MAGQAMRRLSITDKFVPFIVETPRKYPRLRAGRLCAMRASRSSPGSNQARRKTFEAPSLDLVVREVNSLPNQLLLRHLDG